MRNIHWLPRTERTLAPHLVRQRLKTDALIHGGQRTGNSFAWPRVSLHQ